MLRLARDSIVVHSSTLLEERYARGWHCLGLAARYRDGKAHRLEQAQEAFYEDVVIWHSKTRVDNPLLCDGDGPVYQLRRWYEQFYTDVAALPVDVLEHKRFVVRASERA